MHSSCLHCLGQGAEHILPFFPREFPGLDFSIGLRGVGVGVGLVGEGNLTIKRLDPNMVRWNGLLIWLVLFTLLLCMYGVGWDTFACHTICGGQRQLHGDRLSKETLYPLSLLTVSTSMIKHYDQKQVGGRKG